LGNTFICLLCVSRGLRLIVLFAVLFFASPVFASHYFTERWSLKLDSTSDARVDPCIVDGFVYMAHPSRAYVWCLNGSTGVVVWKKVCKSGWGTSLVYDGSNILVNSFDGIYALDPDTGLVSWSVSTGSLGKIVGIAADSSIGVVVASTKSGFFAVKDGALLWQFPADGDASTGGVAVDGSYYAVRTIGSGASMRNVVYRVDCAGGGVVWKSILSMWPSSDPRYAHLKNLFSMRACRPAVADVDGDGITEVLVMDASSEVYCLDSRSGAVKWRSGWLERNGVDGVTVADIDDDGSAEVIVPVAPDWVVLDGSSGKIESHAAKVHLSYVRYGAVVADFDGSGCRDIMFNVRDWGGDALEVWSGYGSSLSRIDVLSRDSDNVWFRYEPVVSDLDGDGRFELIGEVLDYSDGWYKLVVYNTTASAYVNTQDYFSSRNRVWDVPIGSQSSWFFVPSSEKGTGLLIWVVVLSVLAVIIVVVVLSVRFL